MKTLLIHCQCNSQTMENKSDELNINKVETNEGTQTKMPNFSDFIYNIWMVTPYDAIKHYI